MRDALFPDAVGQPVGERSATPTRFLKNLNYTVEPTATRKFPFLACLQVELEGGGSLGSGGDGPDRPGRRYVITLDFVEFREKWRVYYSRVLSPSSGVEESGALSDLEGLIESWKGSGPP